MRKPPERSGSSPKKSSSSNVRSLDERRAQKASKISQPKRPPARTAAQAKRTPTSKAQRSRRLGGATAQRLSDQQRRDMRSNVKRFTSATRGRKALVISLLSSLGALLLLVVATLTTPLIAVEHLRITGLKAVSESQVRKALKDQLGVPLSLINQQHVVDELSAFTRIESVSVAAELPHTLHVSITERSPIAIVVVGGVAYLYDPAGIRLGAAKYSDLYPLISSNGDPAESNSYKEAIAVLLSLPAVLLPKISSVNASTQDNVTLQLRGYAGQSIIWGDASRGILKSRVLSALMANQKPTDRVTFDVSSPDAPVVRWR